MCIMYIFIPFHFESHGEYALKKKKKNVYTILLHYKFCHIIFTNEIRYYFVITLLTYLYYNILAYSDRLLYRYSLKKYTICITQYIYI